MIFFLSRQELHSGESLYTSINFLNNSWQDTTKYKRIYEGDHPAKMIYWGRRTWEEIQVQMILYEPSLADKTLRQTWLKVCCVNQRRGETVALDWGTADFLLSFFYLFGIIFCE